MARTWQVATVAAAVGLAVAVVSVAAAGPWEGGQRTAERTAAASADVERESGVDLDGSLPEPARAVLAGLGGGPSGEHAAAADLPLPTRAGLRAALAPLLASPKLGEDHSLAVMDATTGKLLYGVGADDPAIPASTIKIATAVAALDVLGPEHRIPTTVTRGASDAEIVLVGGGDPTLTAIKGRRGSGQPASLRHLARSTARALKDRGQKSVALRYDVSAYSGPRLHPIGVNENIAPVTALMADEGRVDPESTGHAPRVADPAVDAAKAFGGFLTAEGVEVTSVRQGKADRSVEGRLAEVRSQPLRELVERMLTRSDNDIAEALARQTAMAVGEPASFEGAARAVTGVLKDAGLGVSGMRFYDGSGLNSRDALSAGLLARLLTLAASPDRPGLRPVLSGLPVAGFTGTLHSRFSAATDGETGAGLIRAKTGTLTGVNTLAGIVVDADGRLLTFAFMTKRATDLSALDALASAVAACGCR